MTRWSGSMKLNSPAGGAGKMTTTGEGTQLRPSAPNRAPRPSDSPKRPIPSRPRDSSVCCKPRPKAVVCQFRDRYRESNHSAPPIQSFSFRTFREWLIIRGCARIMRSRIHRETALRMARPLLFISAICRASPRRIPDKNEVSF